ncbi:MAG: hypothetical protein M3H12_18015 [Chromatiales bacterium]
MAIVKGSKGIVKIGEHTVAEINGFSFERTADTIEVSNLNDIAKRFVSDTTSWSGSMDCHMDQFDVSGQEAMSVGSVVDVHFLQDGAGTGDRGGYSPLMKFDYHGSAIVTSVSNTSGKGQTVTVSYSLQGTGLLTKTRI